MFPSWNRLASVFIVSAIASACRSSSSAHSVSVAGASNHPDVRLDGGKMAPPAFPLSIAPSKKFLVDSNGAPFPIVGDSAWSLVTQASDADVTLYLDDRKNRGFTAILVDLMEHKFTSHSPRWKSAAGALPFSNNDDFATANPAFFDHAAWIVEQALARGILVFLTPAYLGYDCGDEGWCREMRASGVEKLTRYGKFVGERFSKYPNVIWVEGGDTVPSATGTPSDLDLVNAVVAGIEAGDGGKHLHTAHWKRGVSSSEGPHVSWLDLDATYSGAGLDTYQDCFDDWKRDQGVRPVFLIEAFYEPTAKGSPPVLRAQMYEPMAAGSAGFFLGNHPVYFFGVPGDGNPAWSFPDAPVTGPWKAELGSRGAAYATYARQLLNSIAWQDLKPDPEHVTARSGSAHFARTLDGRLGLAYFSTAASASIDMSAFAGAARPIWYDPTSGASKASGSQPIANQGRHDFAPPGANAEGGRDWVLVLRVD